MSNPEDSIGKSVVARTAPGELYAKGKVIGYGDYLLALVREVKRLRAEHYLPIPCGVCGRNRLLYLDNEVRCKECGPSFKFCPHCGGEITWQVPQCRPSTPDDD